VDALIEKYFSINQTPANAYWQGISIANYKPILFDFQEK